MTKLINNTTTKRPKDFYYTNKQMVKDLIAITPIKGSVLDAGSGNKIWYYQINTKDKFECEIDRGCDFYKWNILVDWVVGNPPFHESWKFFERALNISQKGIAFLINNLAFNSWTPRRYEMFREKGFYLQRIHIVADKRWFGRYYYLIFGKEDKKLISWELKTY